MSKYEQSLTDSPVCPSALLVKGSQHHDEENIDSEIILVIIVIGACFE